MNKHVDVWEAKKLLEANGFVVLRAKSYRQAQERQRVAENRAMWEERAAEHARAWARDCLAYERRITERCTYLYGLAASLGATQKQLTEYVAHLEANKT